MNLKFWKGKNVLITGYEGFVGSWLSKFLLRTEARIFGLDIKTHRKETILSKEDLNRIGITKGSVENFKLVLEIIKKNKIDIVFHLAAKSIVGDCLRNPQKALKTNVEGTWNVLEACRQAACVQTVVIASSDKAYGEHKKLPYREDTPLQGSHPYDVSKSCSDLIAQMYHHTYKLPVVITRCGNIYGPGDFNFSRIVPDAIRCAILNKTFIIRSDGKFTRDYIFVEDVVNGYIMLAEKAEKQNLFGQAFNFSNEEPLSVITIVRKIYEISGKKPDYRVLNETQHEIKDQYLSSRKAREILKWKVSHSLRNSLEKTYKWYASYFENSKRR
ncbi:MAG: GDP-mannose 4,6-dehydratase [Candidatus Omnitrophica bacterium]|nr:GDP-mannose 4,6-dehydratase [Candidatus Omnitrophota bacterium]